MLWRGWIAGVVGRPMGGSCPYSSCSSLHVQLSIFIELFPWTNSDQEELLGAYVLVSPPVMLGVLGTRAVTGMAGSAFLMVCTFLGKVPLFHFQCQLVPS